ncbi:MAG: FGGY family carbohydrate kinase [Nocardioidaceae bacterium]
MASVVLSVDIGTSSSKECSLTSTVVCSPRRRREHAVDRPRPGHVEMDAEIWWQEFVSLSRELLDAQSVEVVAVGVSGMGPCVLLTDAANTPLRPAILYGVDTRVHRTDRTADPEVRRPGDP